MTQALCIESRGRGQVSREGPTKLGEGPPRGSGLRGRVDVLREGLAASGSSSSLTCFPRGLPKWELVEVWEICFRAVPRKVGRTLRAGIGNIDDTVERNY